MSTQQQTELELIVIEALEFGKDAHQGQKRKYNNRPYFTDHCIEVAHIVKKHGGGPDEVAAALLHDTVEDTKVTHQDILEKFGYKIFELVFWLTDISRGHDGNRELRKTMDRMHLISSRNESVYMIKCADMISNTKTIKGHDPHFAKIYLREKDALLRDMALTLPAWANESSIYQEALESTWN